MGFKTSTEIVAKLNQSPIQFFQAKKSIYAIAFCALSVVHSFAFADSLSDVRELIKAGKSQEALNKINQELSAKPKDPQFRFLKGVVLTDTGRVQDAISTFNKLTEDYPRLPEPYNNLASLYAATGQYDRARAALETAIRTNPSYSVAHENLGDIYALLAGQAYSKALQLDVNKTQAQPKLVLIRDIVNVSGLTPGLAPVPAAPVNNNQNSSVATSTVAANSKPTPVNTPVVQPVPVVKPSNTQVAVNNKPAIAPDVSNNAAAIKQAETTVLAWAKAWSNQDINEYLNSYSKDYVPASGGTHKAWEEDRKAKILGKSKISVNLSGINTSLVDNGNTAIVKFRQNYSAGALQTSTKKTLQLSKFNGKWVIVKEISG